MLNEKSLSCGCAKKKKLDGCKINHLTVLDTLYNYNGYKRATYKCQCDCGNITYIKSTSIYKTQTCGKCNLLKDEVGNRYGRLVVSEMLYNYKNNLTYCKCTCDCGNTVIVKLNSLHTNNTQSCGCIHSPSLIGKRFGKLTVIKEVNGQSNQKMWECKCDCGNTIIRTSYVLSSGHTSSCGCACSENVSTRETFISTLLQNKKIQFEKEKTFDGCIGIGGKKLRFDFYIPSLNCCIEYDGLQHFQPIKFFGGQERFDVLYENDRRKNEYCHTNNILLYRLNYKMNNTEIEKQIDNIIQNPVTITA